MPTSKVRSGKRACEPVQADRVHHRGGDRDDVLAALAPMRTISSANTSVQIGALGRLLARSRRRRARPVELVGLVPLGRVVAEPLAGDRVHDDRAVEPLRLGQRLLDGHAVVAVDGPDVLQPEVLEQPLRRERVLEPFFIAWRASYAAGPTPGTALSRRLTWSSTGS